MTKPFKSLILALAGIGALAACTSNVARHEITNRLGSAAWMLERGIPADPFSLTVHERMHQRGTTANIYIEGDGVSPRLNAQANALKPIDTTPLNPVALHLATRDKASNVAWLARPCQYSAGLDGKACDQTYVSDKRFSPVVLNAYNAALNEMKARYNLEGFNLIGFDGGATIAALLTAQREDVLSLRSVAGNLDHEALSAYHQTPSLDGSLNPVEFANALSRVPQYHFIGGQDTVIPPAVLHSYLQALGDTNCAQYKLVQEAEHTKGWVDKWPDFLAESTACRGPVLDDFPEFELPPEPIRIQRELPSKK